MKPTASRHPRSCPARALEFRLDPDVEADAGAVFGQATVSLTPRCRVTAGLRYTHERKTIDNAGGLYTVDAPSRSCRTAYSYTDAISHDAWTPKFGVEVRARDNAARVRVRHARIQERRLQRHVDGGRTRLWARMGVEL